LDYVELAERTRCFQPFCPATRHRPSA
jgi:hypothetical protein